MPQSVDIILLIFNCVKYKYKAIRQKHTWLKDFTIIPYFHVIGDPQLTTEYVFNDKERLLTIKVEDDYNSLPQKVIQAYAAINTEFNYKYIFKTDDDQHVSNTKIFNSIAGIVLSKTPTIHYAGNVINVDKSYLSQYHKIHPELPPFLPIKATTYCSGRFYILSNTAVKQLLCNNNEIAKEYLEDYAIGYYLHNTMKTTILHIDTNKYFVDMPEI